MEIMLTHTLRIAVAYGTFLAVASQLHKGADPTATVHGDGITPLQLAARNGRLEVCAILLDAGADPAARTPQGLTARDLAMVGGHGTVADFLAEVERGIARRREPSRSGSTYLEFVGRLRVMLKSGDPCSMCRVRVPAEAMNDHTESHAWEAYLAGGPLPY